MVINIYLGMKQSHWREDEDGRFQYRIRNISALHFAGERLRRDSQFRESKQIY